MVPAENMNGVVFKNTFHFLNSDNQFSCSSRILRKGQKLDRVNTPTK